VAVLSALHNALEDTGRLLKAKTFRAAMKPENAD
jgi:hypothetical protein